MVAEAGGTSPRVDGRVERTVRTRASLLEAFRDLLLSGAIDPTSRDVAAAAGITTRTLFRHFPDMESLRRSLIDEAEASATRIMEEPFPESEDWQGALDAVIDRRVQVYESLLPLYVSAIWTRHRTARTPGQGWRGVRRRRARLRTILPERILEDEVLFEALDAVLSIEYWVSLRQDQGLGLQRAVAVLRLAVRRLTGIE